MDAVLISGRERAMDACAIGERWVSTHWLCFKFVMWIVQRMRLGGSLALPACALLTCDVANSDDIVVESMTTVLIRDALIPARESGTLQGLIESPGTTVTRSSEIGTLDSERQQLAVTVAQIALDVARLKATDELSIQTAQAQVREAEQLLAELEITAQINQLKADSDVAIRLAEKTREVAQFELDRAQKAKAAFDGAVSNAELNRLQVLFDQKSLEIEKAREDRAVSALQPAADKAAIAGQSEAVSRTRLLSAQETKLLEIAQSGMASAEYELAIAKLQLERRRLVVPFDGILVETLQSSGEWVEAGTPVYRLIQLDRLRVEGFVDATVAATMTAGDVVDIRFPREPASKTVKGAISFISPEVDPVNHQVRVHAEFDNPEHGVRPGLIATMTLKSSTRPPQ